MARSFPDFSRETAAFARGKALVLGTDEVGRGPIAGPVVAAAVRLDPAAIPLGLDDSKRLSAGRRAALCRAIRDSATVGIGVASVEEIDVLNILHASMLAMERAVAATGLAADWLLVDGNRVPPAMEGRAEAVVGGDGRVLSIAAASIVAKQWRDALMVDLAQQHPGYGWEQNAGYPTAAHLAALRNLGPCAHHRRSFRPVHNILYQEKSLSD